MAKNKSQVSSDANWNEAQVDRLVEDKLKSKGFDPKKFQLQGTDDPELKALIPSKGKGEKSTGRPELIYWLDGESNNLLVIENKVGIKENHSSHKAGEFPIGVISDGEKLKQAKCAEDGIIHYLKGLRKSFNCIGLAISGDSPTKMKITTFKVVRGEQVEKIDLVSIEKISKYLELLQKSNKYGLITQQQINKFAEELHDFLRDEMELEQGEKPLLVSGVMLALYDQSFKNGFRSSKNGKAVSNSLISSIRNTLNNQDIPESKQKIIMNYYETIFNKTAVQTHLKQTVSKIDLNLPITFTFGVDVIGKFYQEFLKYGGGDSKGLGIVLTPHHVAHFFVKLLGVNVNDRVFDICTGTGAFLIAAMNEMIAKAKENEDIIDNIKKNGLIGIEFNEKMFALACSNMILRNDGKSNLHNGSAFDEEIAIKVKEKKPTKAILNPPYAKKSGDKHELAFLDKSLDLLEKDGLAVAIIPTSCILNSDGGWKKTLLEKHTLEAVLSMPEQLFPGVGTITVAVVMRAHTPHDEDKEVWFGYCRNDGFRLNKNQRHDNGAWSEIEKLWIDSFKNRKKVNSEFVDGLKEKMKNETITEKKDLIQSQISLIQECGFESLTAKINADSEWIGEAFMEIDYSKIKPEDFFTFFKKYKLFKLENEVLGDSENELDEEENEKN